MTFKGYYVSPKIGLKNYLATLINFVIASIIIISIFGLTNGTNQETFVKQANKCKSNDCLTQSISSSWPQVTLTSIKTNETTTTSQDSLVKSKKSDLTKKSTKLDKYSTGPFKKRKLQQFNDDLGFNFSPQIDFARDFTRLNIPNFQSFPGGSTRGGLPPTSDDSSDYSDIEGFREIQPSNGGSQGFGQPASIPSPPSQPSVNFQQPPQGQPRQPSFQRVRLQSPPLPGRSPALDLPSVAFANAPSSALQNQPGNEPRFQRINVRQRLPNSPVSQPLEPARSPNQPFRRLPVFRAPENVDNPRRPVTAEELALGIPPASSGNNAPPPASALGNEFAVPSVTSAPLPTGPPRTRRIRPTAGGSRRIRPVGNRIRTGTRVSSAVDDVAPTAVVVNRPPSTPTPIGFNGEEVDTVNLERNPDSRRIRGSRRPVAASAVRTGSNNFRRRPVPLSPESVSAAEEEVIGNNALDAGDSVEAGFGSKIKDEVTYSAAPISPNGPIVVDYLTTFTYLTTVIRGPHTLLTSRESTASVRVTQPYDPSIAEIVSVSGGNIRPTRTSNLGTKTRGPTTTIVNVQSNVHIAGYSAAHVIPTRAPPLDFSRTRKPVIETAPQRIPQPVRPSVLRAEILSSVPKALHTEFTYFYTVHDGANTRRSTRSELTTAPVTDNAVLATLQLDTTVNADGFISLGSGPSTVNLGKRVFGGSTTEVNLAMRTYLKLDGISNVRIEPTATRPPSVAASEAPVRATYVPRQPLESSVPSLDSSTPVLESSFPSSAGETDATPSIGLSPSQSGTFIRSRRPIRVSSTAINPELIRSRVVTGRPGQRIRTRPNFNRLQRPRVSLEEPEATEVVGSGLESSNIASTPYLSEPVLEATASPVFNSEDIRSTPISSSVNSSMKRVAVTVRRPYGGDQLRSRLRRPFRPTETTEPKFLVVTRSGPVGLVRSTKSRFRVASRVVRPPGSSGESPQITPEVSSDISEPSVSVVSSIDPTLSSVLVTYFTTTTHTVPYTFNDKTHLTTIEVTNSRVATESLDSSVFVDKTNKLLASSALEPSSPVTFEPTLVTGAAVSMRDGLSSTDDLETRTVYTTYTYFTTYYNGPSSIISSSEQVVSNLVTVPRTEPLPIIPTSSDSSAPITVVETSEKIETSTIYSTYTYFATMFNGSRSVITPIEETRSEVLTLREPVRITRTINSTRSTAIRPPDSSIFSRTYFTTYTKFLTYGDADSKSTSATEEVVSNVVTFTLPNGPQSTPPLDRIYTTETINQLSAFSSLLTTKSTHTTLTHFITLFSGTQTILSSIEEVSPTVVTQYVGATEGPTQKDTRRVNGQNIRLTQADAESLKSSRDLMTALIPSISTLHVTHTYYTTFFNGHTSIVASRTEATSSLVTLYVPNSSAQRPSSSSDQVITMYKSADPAAVGGGLVTSYATVGSTPTAPLPSSVAFDRHHHQHKPGEYEGASLSVQPSLRLESSRVDQLESSIISRVVENLKSSQGLSEDQISSVILNAASGIGKSTTVIGGSTVVFFPDLVFKPSTSDSINPTKNSGTNGESTIKPGTVIELSDLLGGGSNINLAGGLGDTIKDIVHLIAQNAAKANKTNENVDRIESSKVNFPQGGVTLTHDADPIYIPLGGKAKSNETDGERAYQPEFGIEAGEDGAPSGSGNDDLGTYGGYQRKNDVYLRNNKPDLNGLEGSQIQPTSASSETPLLSTSSPDGVYSQVSSGATTIFFGTDALESGQLAPTAGDSASPSVTSTRFVTSVENLTRTLTLTTTKVYYTRDSPLTITSVLTTTIPPRTFVSTIIGSRTITGTAGDPTKTVAVEPATSIDDESTTTVTTTTLIFNSITTTVVRTLVIPTSGIEPTKPVTTRVPVTQRPSRRPYTPFRAPQRPTTPPPSKRKGNDKPSVNIRPPGSRTRSPYLPKRPVTPPPSATVSSIGDEDSRSSTTPRPMTTPKIIDDDQCRPACSNKQVCKENGGVFRCECRPGFTKKEGSDKCEEMQSYIVVVKLMKVGESSVLYRTELADSASNEYQKIAKLAKEEIDKAYRNTTIKENYIGANVNGINKTSSGDDGVLVNLTVHLASRDDLDEDILKSELSKSLIDTESLPSPSSITADVQAVLDFDECSDNKYNDCDPAAYCINRPGSYRCECKGPYTDMDPSVPGRHCSSEIKNCEACHGRGDCVRSEDGERTTCKCQRMYLGERCEINGLLLATFLPIAAILSIVCVCCIVYCCRKYKKKNNYPKGFKNIVAFAPPTIGANTLDRKAMLETSSESSEHFRHAQHDGTNTIGGYPSGNGSTRRHMSHEMSLDRSLGPVGGGSFIAMPPQVTIPRARHINQSTESQQDSPTTTATKMDPDSLERRKSTPDTPTDDSLPPTNFKRVFRSQTRPTPKFDMRSESRTESRSFHRTDHHSDKDFIEWTPSKRYDQNHHHQQQQQQQQNESLRSNQSLSKTLKSYKGLADLRIGHFDWQWKMLRNGHGSYSPNDNRRKKKSVSEVNPSFDLSLRDSPSTSSSQRFPESSEIMMEDHKNEKEESVASYSTTWTGGPAQYHLADDLISLERRSQVSNWGRLPFYDN